MTPKTYRIKKIKSDIDKIWENPKSHLLENHYKFMRKILVSNYPNSIGNISPETLEEILQDLIYMDRFLRRKREGTQNKLKDKLSKEFKKEL